VTYPRTCLARLVVVVGLIGRAAGAAPSVELANCPALDGKAIARHLADELRAMSVELDRLEAPPIHIDCAQDSLRVEVRDPLTGKTLARDVPAPKAHDPAADRMVALAVSELFLSSWLELLLPPAERKPPPAAPPVSVSSAEEVARKAVAPSTTRVDTTVLGGIGVRDLGKPYPTLRLGLRSGPVFGRVAPFVGVGFETGQARRERGTVSTRSVTIALGVRWRLLGGARAALDLVGSGAFGYAFAHGSAAQSTDVASSASGALVELGLGLSPAVDLGGVELFFEPLVGNTFPKLSARVAGEAPVRWSGLWCAALIGLRLGGGP
jgi:hypothetical protein